MVFDPAADSKEKATAFLEKDITESFLRTRESLSVLWNFHVKSSEEKSQNAEAIYHQANLLTLIVSVIGLCFAVGIGFFFSQYLSKTIMGMASQILNSANEASSASSQLTSASSQLSQGATESAASLEETVSSLEELSSMVKLNSDHAKEANSLSQKSLSSAEDGEQEISKLISAMSDMGKSSKKIEEIINVIDDIAFQTNLLALNAAVEAARAGDQGKGFAVVADAVRNLASRSASAAKDINVLIKENVEKTVEGSKIADVSGHSLKEIVTSAKKVADLNSEISAASQEQANGIEQISKAMNHLDQAIQTNASSSEEVASSSEEMSSQASCLKELVGDLTKFVTGKSSSQLIEAPVKKTSNKSKNFPDKSSTGGHKAANVIPFESDSNIGKADGF